MTGGGGLTKSGAGLWTLGATRHLFRAHERQAGTLKLGIAGAVPLRFRPDDQRRRLDATGYTPTVSSFTIGSGGALNLTIGDLFTSTGAASLGGGTLNLFGAATGTTELMSYSSSSGVGLTLGAAPAGYSLKYLSNQLDLILTPQGIWTSAVSGSWSAGGNWSTTPPPNGAGKAAQFTQPVSTPLTVTLDQAVTLGTILFDNTGGNTSTGYTISGPTP